MGPISKMGNGYLRRLLFVGACAVICRAQIARAAGRPVSGPLASWALALLDRHKAFKVVAAALANKLARIAWAVMARGERYRATASGAPARSRLLATAP